MKTLTKVIITLTAAGLTYALVQKRKKSQSSEKPVEIHGFVSAGFEAVREAFAENFSKRAKLAQLAAFITKAKRLSICGAACETRR